MRKEENTDGYGEAAVDWRTRAAIIFALNHFITGDRSNHAVFPKYAHAENMAVISWTTQILSEPMDAFRNHCLLNALHLPTP